MSAVSNAMVARILDELAKLSELDEGSPQAFRVRAYSNAKRAVESLETDVASMSAGELAKVRGIGPSIAGRIREYIDTGRIAKLDELRAKHPPDKVALTQIPGLGPKSIARLETELGIRDLDTLIAALDDGRIAALDGFGARTVEKLRTGITALGMHSKERRVPLADALPVAERLVDAFRNEDEVADAAYAGSLRRFRETVGDLDILVSANEPIALLDVAAQEVDIATVIGQGTTKVSFVTREGLQVDIRRVAPESFGAALVYFTGSKAHNIRLRQRAQDRGMTLNEYGYRAFDEPETVPRNGATEHDVYGAVGLAWIWPELREDDGEIERADGRALPDFVEIDAIRGDLHDHTDLSGDGRMSLETLVAAAVERGWEYLAITDHAENLTINGVDEAAMRAQRRAIRNLEASRGDIRLLHGAELNIGLDGALDYDSDFLETFDWLVASVHSYFDRDVATQTDRIITAMEHPSVTSIGHLTGRMVGRRPPIVLDLDRIFEAAVRTGTAVEINASLARLDPSAETLRDAQRAGVSLVIATDAHAPGDLDRMRYGAAQARRAGLGPDDIQNCLPAAEFLSWCAAIRA